MFLQVSIAAIKSNHMKQSELYREVIALSQSCVLPLLLRKSLLSKSSSFLLRTEFLSSVRCSTQTAVLALANACIGHRKAF